MKILDIKEVKGVILYKFSEPIRTSQAVQFGQNDFSLLGKQHGQYFEIKDLGEKVFHKNINDNVTIASNPYMIYTWEYYLKNVITPLVLETNIVEFSVKQNQTTEVVATDAQWASLYSGVIESDSININLPPTDYTQFEHPKYGFLIRR